MSATTKRSTAPREELVNAIAEQLPSRVGVLVRLLVKQVRRSDISRTEIEVLSILSDGPQRITELTELMSTAQPTMTLLVKRLEAKGLVSRAQVASDRRVVLVTITAAGTTTLNSFRAQAAAAMRVDLGGLADRQLRSLAAATDALGGFVDELQRRD
jgi:DNA-binding MarR family transcriptional regulator